MNILLINKNFIINIIYYLLKLINNNSRLNFNKELRQYKLKEKKIKIDFSIVNYNDFIKDNINDEILNFINKNNNIINNNNKINIYNNNCEINNKINNSKINNKINNSEINNKINNSEINIYNTIISDLKIIYRYFKYNKN
jgi:hypothetical protein